MFFLKSTTIRYIATALGFVVAVFDFGVVFAESRVYVQEQAPIIGGGFSVDIRVDTTEPLNAYSVNLQYDPNILSVERIRATDSIVDVWREQGREITSGILAFEGASFEEFSGHAGKIATVDFIPRRSDNVTLYFSEAEVYLADGNGTRIVPTSDLWSAFVPMSGSSGSPTKETSAKVISAELFADPFQPDQKFLSFEIEGDNVRDTLIRSRSFLTWTDWESVRNPAPLLASVWSVEVRVVDRAGNIQEVVVYDWPFFLVWRIIPILLFIITILVFIVSRRRRVGY
jgi:hypothetical protein